MKQRRTNKNNNKNNNNKNNNKNNNNKNNNNKNKNKKNKNSHNDKNDKCDNKKEVIDNNEFDVEVIDLNAIELQKSVNTNCWMIPASLLTIILCIITFIAVYHGDHVPRDIVYEVRYRFNDDMLIPRVISMNWEDTPEFITKVTDMKFPTVIRGAPITSEWKAFKYFTRFPYRMKKSVRKQQKDIAKNWRQSLDTILYNIKSNEDALFCPSKHMKGQLPSTNTRRDIYSLHNMTLIEFLAACNATFHRDERTRVEKLDIPSYLLERFMYFGGEVDEEIKKYIQPSKQFHIKAKKQADSVQTLWMASEGTTANLHFDQSHNFVVQLTGHKIWTFFPPWMSSKLYIYPSTHPHYRNSQIDLLNPDTNLHFPLIEEARGLQVQINPGEIIYVPPYWAHTVLSGDKVNVATSILSVSDEQMKCDSLQFIKVPIKRSWPLATKGYLTLKYLRIILLRYYNEFPPKSLKLPINETTAIMYFAETSLIPRYSHLISSLLEYTTNEMSDLLTRDGCTFTKQNPIAIDKNIVQSLEKSAVEVVDGLKDIREQAKSLHSSLNSFNQALLYAISQSNMRRKQRRKTTKFLTEFSIDFDIGISDICLSNYMDGLIASTVGPDNVGAFVQFCYANDDDEIVENDNKDNIS